VILELLSSFPKATVMKNECEFVSLGETESEECNLFCYSSKLPRKLHLYDYLLVCKDNKLKCRPYLEAMERRDYLGLQR